MVDKYKEWRDNFLYEKSKEVGPKETKYMSKGDLLLMTLNEDNAVSK